jgi:hypothetical protein
MKSFDRQLKKGAPKAATPQGGDAAQEAERVKKWGPQKRFVQHYENGKIYLIDTQLKKGGHTQRFQ